MEPEEPPEITEETPALENTVSTVEKPPMVAIKGQMVALEAVEVVITTTTQRLVTEVRTEQTAKMELREDGDPEMEEEVKEELQENLVNLVQIYIQEVVEHLLLPKIAMRLEAMEVLVLPNYLKTAQSLVILEVNPIPLAEAAEDTEEAAEVVLISAVLQCVMAPVPKVLSLFAMRAHKRG